MVPPDFNLLVTLDVLLAENNVARAAKRLRLSPSAMSRALARLREATGDPLLVRAGRGLVPTPRALELRDHVSQLVPSVEAVLRPAGRLDLSRLQRTFTLRAREGFVETFGPGLLLRVAQDAPGVRLHFVQKADKESAPLREGAVDLETGVIDGTTGPELRTLALFHDRYIGVARAGHPLCESNITPVDYSAARHVSVERHGSGNGRIDEALQALGLHRRIVASVDTFSAALALTRSTDLVASVPEKHTEGLRHGLYPFPLPFPAPEITVALIWHPRMDADQGHIWLRACIRDVCTGSVAHPSAAIAPRPHSQLRSK